MCRPSNIDVKLGCYSYLLKILILTLTVCELRRGFALQCFHYDGVLDGEEGLSGAVLALGWFVALWWCSLLGSGSLHCLGLRCGCVSMVHVWCGCAGAWDAVWKWLVQVVDENGLRRDYGTIHWFLFLYQMN